MIRIIECGSQVTHNIARRIREQEVYADIVPYTTAPADILKGDIDGLILSGGPWSVYDKDTPTVEKSLLRGDKPVLGICYGLQLMSHLLGGKVTKTGTREYGRTKITVEKDSPLFKGLPKRFDVWMSHGDIVDKVPEGFEVIARSENGHIAAIQHKTKALYAVQFHPEVDHTEHGRDILKNYLDIIGAETEWTTERQYAQLIDELKNRVRGKVGVGGVSGGVDSTVAALLLAEVAGDDFHPIFVDNGLLREGEKEEVIARLTPKLPKLHVVDAKERFLTALEGITDPDEKRKVIGHVFIEVFEEEAKKIERASYLLQGTLYPDVIESVAVFGATSKIKRHHNVGGLPKKLGLDIVEPFRFLFKDEVRCIAEQELKLPKELVWRHPFPGPGLGVRIIGQVTEEKLDTLRKADRIFIDELKRTGIYYEVSQALAVLTDTSTVGVMGDAHSYEHVIALRAVQTHDFMTADVYPFDLKALTKLGSRIINSVPGVNRVVYDVTQKPPGTIEWE